MSNYKQPYIPVVDNAQFQGMTLGQVKRHVTAYFNQNLRNTSVKNLHKGITIDVKMAGLRHVVYARDPGFAKIKAVYCNFGEPDANDHPTVLGYFNFKCKVNVEGKNELFRIVVRLTTNGKFYYDHAVRVVR